MDDLTKSILEEIDNKPDNENYSSRNSAEIDGDDKNYASSFGLIVAICAAALLFGGETFNWWTVTWEFENVDTEEDGFAFEGKVVLEHGMDEGQLEQKFDVDFNDESLQDFTEKETNSTKWDDDDCTTDDEGEDTECTELLGFFTNLKYMVYGLLVCGLALAYVGQANQIEHVSTLAIIGALISAGILAYTFVALPPAFEEDTEFFEDSMNEDPAFFMNSGKEEYDDVFETDMKTYSKAMPGLAYFIPVITLTLCSYLIIYNRD